MEAIKQLFSTYPDIVNIESLCAMLDISKNTAYGMIKTGAVEGVKVGRKYMIPKANIIEYLGRNLVH